MEIGAARDQIVRCLQRLTLSFVVGDDVIRSRVHHAIEELTMLAEYLPTELPKPSWTAPPAPAPEVPAVDLTGPIMPMTNPPTPQPDYTPPPTVHPRLEPQMSATPHPAVPEPFPTSSTAPLAGEHHGDYIDPGAPSDPAFAPNAPPGPLAEATPNAPSTVEHTSPATFRGEAFTVPGVFVTSTPAEPQPADARPQEAIVDAPYVRP